MAQGEATPGLAAALLQRRRAVTSRGGQLSELPASVFRYNTSAVPCCSIQIILHQECVSLLSAPPCVMLHDQSVFAHEACWGSTNADAPYPRHQIYPMKGIHVCRVTCRRSCTAMHGVGCPSLGVRLDVALCLGLHVGICFGMHLGLCPGIHVGLGQRLDVALCFSFHRSLRFRLGGARCRRFRGFARRRLHDCLCLLRHALCLRIRLRGCFRLHLSSQLGHARTQLQPPRHCELMNDAASSGFVHCTSARRWLVDTCASASIIMPQVCFACTMQGVRVYCSVATEKLKNLRRRAAS